MTQSFPIVINGAGLAGCAAALGLARQGWHCRLVDPQAAPFNQISLQRAEEWDARVYAFAPRPWQWLQAQGVDFAQVRAQPVRAMCVYGDDGGFLRFSAEEAELPFLAVIAEASAVRAAIGKALSKRDVEMRFDPAAQLTHAERHAGHWTLRTAGGEEWATPLLIGAEGRQSWTREMVGISSWQTEYGQTAVVANLRCERAHQATAYQWFRGAEVVAYLPLPGNVISLVWSAPHALAQELMSLALPEFAERVAAVSGFALGGMEVITPPQGFALSLLRCERMTAPRVALVGDAAHGIHPLSGHGINLGFNDAAALAQILGSADKGADPGDAVLLARYERRRFEEPFLLQTTTDLLARLYAWSSPWVQVLRNRGLNWVDRLVPVKRVLARYAALAQW